MSSSSKPCAWICLTGSELTRGETRDLNGAFLGAELTTLGLAVRRILVVPDEPDELAAAIREAIERAAVVVLSGGLGPTADDQTIAVLARVLGREVIQDPEARRRMRERILERVGSEDRIPANYFKQAEVVAGSTVLQNPVGLAPGCLVETERGFVASLPGVPEELRAMFRERLVPEILERFHMEPPRIYRAKILGIGESWAEARIRELPIDFEHLEYGISARPGELLVKLVAHDSRWHGALEAAARALEGEFGEDLVGLEAGLLDASGDPWMIDHARLVHDLLVPSGRTVATAESCTGGLVAKLLTDNPGSSAYFAGSVVAYENRIKERVLGVPAELLDRHGAVSRQVCETMARSVRQLFDTTYGIGITGIAGPGGASREKPVGLVYIGIAAPPREGEDPAEAPVVVEERRFWGRRGAVRRQAATRALELLRRDLVRNDRPAAGDRDR